MGPRRGPLPEGRSGDGRGRPLGTEILAQYFPGAEAADEATGRAWQSFSGQGFHLESLDAADAAYLPELARARAEASQRSGLNAAAPFTVRAFASTPAFRNATLAPGWVAAFTEGNWIATQPLRTLAARHLLDATMRHEFLHALVEAKPARPRHCGCAKDWSKSGRMELADRIGRPRSAAMPSMLPWPTPLPKRSPHSAHRAAAWYAAQLLSATAGDRCSSGCAQAFPPESPPASGSGRSVRRS